MEVLRTVLWIINGMVLAYFVLLNGVYLLTSLMAQRSLKRYYRRLNSLDIEELVSSSGAPPITLIAPAYNEQASCVESARSLLTLQYPEFEVVVVNDGSKDDTLTRLKESFDLKSSVRAPTATIDTKPVRGIYRSRLYPNLWVIDKENGGKSDALNVGINFSRTPLFCAMDADSLLEPDALIRMARVFLEDGRTVAAGGSIRIVNDCVIEDGSIREIRLPKRFLPAIQVVEYPRAFLAGRMGWSELNATLVISGAFGVFRRSAVVDAGGYSTSTVGEDMELIVRLHRHHRRRRKPYRVVFVPDPVAWTEAPESIRILSRQRDRWQRGLWETLWTHKQLLFNPRYGAVGMLAFPYFFFIEMLGPLIEAIGYAGFAVTAAMGWLTPLYSVAFLFAAIVLGMSLSFLALGLEEISFRKYKRLEDLLRMFWLVIIENFGYRQMTTFMRIRGVFSSIRGRKGWGVMERRGFQKK
jgi:cellulose synthase/poly-beta-1,6-N-acetylglucosamine synthase-like glycosyltransferase